MPVPTRRERKNDSPSGTITLPRNEVRMFSPAIEFDGYLGEIKQTGDLKWEMPLPNRWRWRRTNAVSEAMLIKAAAIGGIGRVGKGA